MQSPLRMPDLAASVGLSERTLLRQFQSVLDVGPRQYFRTLRLDFARRLLENSDMSIAEISLACGFDSRISFSRAFKEAFGTPPSRYRANPGV